MLLLGCLYFWCHNHCILHITSRASAGCTSRSCLKLLIGICPIHDDTNTSVPISSSEISVFVTQCVRPPSGMQDGTTYLFLWSCSWYKCRKWHWRKSLILREISFSWVRRLIPLLYANIKYTICIDGAGSQFVWFSIKTGCL